MGYWNRQWAKMKRLGHRRGYGVHSPFAFNFLTFVVYERGAYYAYRDLAARHPVRRLGGRHEKACRKFLFRLANYVHPSTIRLVGHVGEAEADYLSAGCCSASVVKGETQACPDGHTPTDELTWIGQDVPTQAWAGLIAHPASEHSVCVVAGIHRSKEAEAAWKEVKNSGVVTVSFDLYDYGLVFYDRTKQTQHYTVYF